MSKRLWFLALFSVLVVSAPVWLSGAAQAGPPTVCGDGTITDPPEKCDDSNTVTGDGCSFPSCLPEVCGDGIPNPDPPSSETCDDGNTVSDDGCSATCETECGNGAINGDEECDTSGESETCDDDCTNPLCGDNNVNETAGEACDDGNTVDDATCLGDCSGVPGEPPTKKQQACINAANKNLAGVVKAQTGDTSACFKAAAKGDPVTCYGADAKTKVAKAQAKTDKTVAGKKCTGEGLPTSVVIPVAATINAAGEDQILEASTIVFGNPPVIAAKATAKEAAACQAEVIKQLNAITNKWIAEANKAKKATLKAGTVASAGELATALNAALDDNDNVVKATTKANAAIDKKCTDALVADNFDCAGATTLEQLRLCVSAVAQAGACEAFEAADVLDLDCPAPPAPVP
jgi:cysteine-rich repeat protein